MFGTFVVISYSFIITYNCLKMNFVIPLIFRSGSGRRRHRMCRFKRKESNYISLICHVIIIVLVCIAMAESRWFYIQGSRCSDADHTTLNYLGIKTFFYEGSGPASGSAFVNRNAYFYGNSLHDGNCLLLVLC